MILFNLNTCTQSATYKLNEIIIHGSNKTQSLHTELFQWHIQDSIEIIACNRGAKNTRIRNNEGFMVSEDTYFQLFCGRPGMEDFITDSRLLFSTDLTELWFPRGRP